MPEFLGSLISPRLTTAPSSPVTGQLYYDTAQNKLFYWNGTAWVSGSGGSEYYEQPGTPAGASNGALWVDTDDVPPAWASLVPLVSSLPSNPVDGQEVYFQDTTLAAAGIIWHLRYRAASASTYKWEVLGQPPPLGAFVGANETVAGTSAWLDPTTVGPRVIPPLKGEYTAQGLSNVYSTTAGTAFWLGIAVNATSASFGMPMTLGVINSGYHSSTMTYGTSRMTVANVGDDIRLRYMSQTNASQVQYRTINVWPARVG